MRAVGPETPQTVRDWINLGDLLQRRGRLTLKALGRVKHGDLPPTAEG
jgi:hypothetical protein